ncbi:DUF1772 domain-containing protein [Paeniglutamicibacter sp. ABSL32-1]|uniref:anthrone oxygenase family protein n=1 Tax=Paeniglutamicibacter quisquiliarum TaxID=2849498 RepID=UPI001C2D0719|nr:DUF1772 domain-containing protein [Paeniglutamicibacter quisquiliarum]
MRNVPLNNDLARIAPGTADAAAPWAAFDRGWSRANHVRAAASIGAALVLLDALARPA